MNPILEQMLRGIVGQKIGSYRLDKFIGIGGFGGVFKASEMVRNTAVKEVALKIIPESSDEQLRELLTARELEHPYLVRSYGVGECQFFNIEMLYLAMELAKGSLDKQIERGKLPEDTVKNITQQVASGLTFLHDNSRVHRDLKPANILSVNRQWKLSDFGLIRQLNNNTHTQTVNTSGTIVYMPPEAFEGNISPAWDVWSLGIMLVEMLTNQLPYRFDNDINKLMGKVMKADLQIPRLPREFQPIVTGCLQRDRRQRWTAKQVLSALSGGKVGIAHPTFDESPIPQKGESFTEMLPNGVKLEMVYIPAGSFMMGTNKREDEQPIHKVTFKQGFYMGKYSITQAQYKAIMGKNPSNFKGENHPVECVSWNDAQQFCQKLSSKIGKKYKLPSESQWEYACRAGSKTKWCFGDDKNQLSEYAWYNNNSDRQTHPVGQKKPNAWGLYDMHGNVWEWCEDDWHDNYQNAPNDGTSWLEKKDKYVVRRGGSWDYNPNYCRSASRYNYLGTRDYFNYYIGFRVVCELD